MLDGKHSGCQTHWTLNLAIRGGVKNSLTFCSLRFSRHTFITAPNVDILGTFSPHEPRHGHS